VKELRESNRLESIATRSTYAAGVNSDAVEYCFRVFSRFISGSSILELGPAEGVMTERLVSLGLDMTVVEGAESFCIDLRSRYPSATVVNSLFEDFQTAEKFDNVVLGHVLEHVDDPVGVLERAGDWLSDGGRILAAVPNSRSLHRQAAVLMGLLESEDSLNEADVAHGHRRVFNPESFRSVFFRAGLQIDFFGGYWLKPIANSQIESDWTTEMLDSFMALGERYPDIAGEIYVVASLPTGA
jgi:2-polyprenyl-3-methyl-5-hydroxy-6-metoxy-1,4-benzoquinol methylase